MRYWSLMTMLLANFTVMAQTELVVEVMTTRAVEGGTLRLVLCPDQTSFDKEAGCIPKEVPVRTANVRFVFPGLSKGSYAIKVFHDVNANGELDTNFFGIPKEPYGFSNNAMGLFGPPSFDQAAFTVVGQPAEKHEIRLR